MEIMKHPRQFFADSHVGLVREDNEDTYGFHTSQSEEVSFAVVADGVGGHDRGEVASQLTVQLFRAASTFANFSTDSSSTCLFCTKFCMITNSIDAESRNRSRYRSDFRVRQWCRECI